jgi:tRNA G18 (ribose-2'-O)-methylase SpoU
MILKAQKCIFNNIIFSKYEFISNRKCCLAALRSTYRKVEDIFISANYKESQPPALKSIMEYATKKNLKIKFVSNEKLKKLNNNEKTHGVVIKCIFRKFKDIKTFSDFKSSYIKKEKENLVIIIDRYSDGYGVGGIMRSAHYFGATAIIFDKISKPTHLVQIGKQSEGASDFYEFLSVKFIKKFLQEARKEGWTIVSSDIEKVDEDYNEEKKINETVDYDDKLECKKVELEELPNDILRNNNVIVVLSSYEDSHIKSSDYKVNIKPLYKMKDKYLVDSLNSSVHTAFILQRIKSGVVNQTE